MHRLKHIKDTLLCAIETQLGDLSRVDTKELGEVVDMVKDMEEAMYYCSITKAMEENKKEEEEFKEFKRKKNYLPMSVYYPERDYRDMDKHEGKMYYDGNRGMNSGMMNSSNRSTSGSYPVEIRDVREGRSSISRKNYMESKELHKGSHEQMKELEKYMQELTQDITEMISDASPEEKAILQQKLSLLASKIK